MNIFSKYLSKEFDVTVIEGENNGKAISIISHDSLRNILIDISKEYNISYEYTSLEVSINHNVFLCTIQDNKGRKITEIGESSKASLYGDIGNKYPTLTAAQRAFDRAVIAFLGFDGKYLSSTEVNDIIPEILKSYNKTEANEPIKTPETTEIPDIPEIIDDEIILDESETYTDAYISTNTMEHIDESDEFIEEPFVGTDKDAELKKAEETVISFGRLKGQKVAEAATSKNIEYIKYTLTFTKTTSKIKEEIAALKLVCENKGLL